VCWVGSVTIMHYKAYRAVVMKQICAENLYFKGILKLINFIS